MRKLTLLTVGVILCSLWLTSCGRQAPLQMLPRCDTLGSSWNQAATNVAGVYQPAAPDNCLLYLAPYDQSGWWESRLNSRRIRGEDSLPLGCTHCPGGNLDCKSPNNCGGCSTVSLNFDLSRFPEDSEISTAKLAVFAVDKPELAAQAIVEGRMNIGGDFQVIADEPRVVGNWIFFDITPFACRGVVERRNSVTIDLSLPCGDERARLATIGLGGGLSPTLIVEFK